MESEENLNLSAFIISGMAPGSFINFFKYETFVLSRA